MYNCLNRFVRKHKTSFIAKNEGLCVESTLFVPERIHSSTVIDWETIYNHISDFIGAKGITDIGPFELNLNENNNILSSSITYTADNSREYVLSSSVNLSAYRTSVEEDPLFWQSERSIPISSFADISSNITPVYELSIDKCHEQAFIKGDNDISGTYYMAMPSADPRKAGKFILYLEEKPTDDFHYSLSATHIRTLPSRKPWLTDTGNGIWKFEFASIPENNNWQYVQATKFKTT